MNDTNVVVLIGRLTKDVELRNTSTGKSVASFSIANNRKYNDNEEVSYFNCIAWGKLGETIAKYCSKGNRILVNGRLQQRTWEDKNGNKRYEIEIIAENVQFLESKKQDDISANPFE